MTRRRSYDDRSGKNSLSRDKRDLLNFHLPLESISGTFDDYSQYLRADVTLCLDFIQDVKKLLSEPSQSRLKSISSRYREKFARLEKLKKGSEKENGGKYPITEFFEENKIKDPERKTLRLLFAKNGVGVQTDNPCLTGEELIVALRILEEGIKVKDARKILQKNSKLQDNHFIGFRKRKDLELERSQIGISEIAVSEILGEEERAERFRDILREQEEFTASFSLGVEKESHTDSLLVKEEARYSIDDVVLPSQEIKEPILSVLDMYKENDKFYDEWNMKSVMGENKGTNLLFSGPSGTGKTMMAKAIGSYLDKEVRYVAFDSLLSSYYAGSERNIGKLFEEINESDCVVIIDEADGLLNRRGQASSSTDSTENRLVDIFLRELEEHEGIVVMTSNFTKNIDKAVDRRLDLSLEFPFPDEKARKKIWQTHVPEEMPLSKEVDFDRIAEKFEVTGGQIKNAVINAARKAISDGKEKVTQKHFEYGAKLENDSAMEYSLHDDEFNEERKMGYA